MKTYTHSNSLMYDGSQLSPMFAYSTFKLRGDSIVFFKGACAVKEHMCDIEDIVLGEFISSDKLLHCIVEIFKSPPSLIEARMFQLLLVENATTLLKQMNKTSEGIYCDGDDIFLIGGDGKRRKLSVSIATVSGISYLIHFAVNITGTGIPKEVTAGCLNDINVDPEYFAELLGDRMVHVYDEDIIPALNKVKAV